LGRFCRIACSGVKEANSFEAASAPSWAQAQTHASMRACHQKCQGNTRVKIASIAVWDSSGRKLGAILSLYGLDLLEALLDGRVWPFVCFPVPEAGGEGLPVVCSTGGYIPFAFSSVVSQSRWAFTGPIPDRSGDELMRPICGVPPPRAAPASGPALKVWLLGAPVPA